MEHHDVSQIKLNILKQLVNLSRRVYIYISLSLDLSRDMPRSFCGEVQFWQLQGDAPADFGISPKISGNRQIIQVTLDSDTGENMTTYHKIQCISSLWFQPGTWNPFFYGHICKSLLSWSLFQATSARRPQRHDEKRCLLVGSKVCKQWSYVAAMSHLILIKWPKRGHNWFSNPLDIFEHVWNWSSPCDEIGSWLWGAHRAAQRHPSSGRRPGAEGWGLLFNDLPSSPEHWSTLGDPSKPYLSARISQRLNGVAICWLMMWDDVGLYSYTIPHIGITRIHDRNSEELKNNSEELRGTWVAPHFALWGTTQYLTLPWSL